MANRRRTSREKLQAHQQSPGPHGRTRDVEVVDHPVPGFPETADAQARAVAASEREVEDQAFIDALGRDP